MWNFFGGISASQKLCNDTIFCSDSDVVDAQFAHIRYQIKSLCNRAEVIRIKVLLCRSLYEERFQKIWTGGFVFFHKQAITLGTNLNHEVWGKFTNFLDILLWHSIQRLKRQCYHFFCSNSGLTIQGKCEEKNCQAQLGRKRIRQVVVFVNNPSPTQAVTLAFWFCIVFSPRPQKAKITTVTTLGQSKKVIVSPGLSSISTVSYPLMLESLLRPVSLLLVLSVRG